ncbi:MAG: hypothetical protein ACKV2V_09695 [Blastocatellia bacterium]
MSVNRHNPHVLVLPEDEANRRLANGFHKEIDGLHSRRFQVLPEAGGWLKVMDHFTANELADLKRFPQRRLVLMIDFDRQEDRLASIKTRIPGALLDRVFVLGALGEPEDLKTAGPGSLETIGQNLARDCRDETEAVWNHELLRHNTEELARMRTNIRPILFPV